MLREIWKGTLTNCMMALGTMSVRSVDILHQSEKDHLKQCMRGKWFMFNVSYGPMHSFNVFLQPFLMQHIYIFSWCSSIWLFKLLKKVIKGVCVWRVIWKGILMNCMRTLGTMSVRSVDILHQSEKDHLKQCMRRKWVMFKVSNVPMHSFNVFLQVTPFWCSLSTVFTYTFSWYS